MIKLMERVLTLMLTELTTMVIGLMINNMVLALKLGQMVHNMKVNMQLVKNMEEVNLNGQITLVLKEILMITIQKDKDNKIGRAHV